MDDIVRAALIKWPSVPHCYGWLALDARGDWYMRDERIQAAGAFPLVKGSRIDHVLLREFIHRNYECDAAGCWFFQNGPQRVYVELEAAPWVWRLHPCANAPALQSHTGRTAQFKSAHLDEAGHLYIDSDLGLGLVHTQDMGLAADAVLAGTWTPTPVLRHELPARHHFVLQPHAPQA